jgi:hypothetical protein
MSIKQGGNTIAGGMPSDINDYVVESQFPTAQNNYTWYRKYKSGWIEQGGYDNTTRTASSAAAAVAAITFPAAFADTNYTFIATVTGDYNGIQEYNNPTRTATGLTVCIIACYPNNTYTSKGFSWHASGMSAS